MALFTDGLISSIEDLTAQDSQLPNVASVEGIDVTQKLKIAQEFLAMELVTALNLSGSIEQPFWRTATPKLDGVVVTPPLKVWHTARSLELVYGDAYNSQLNDRYAGKRNQFRALSKWAFEKLRQIGIGLVTLPIPQAEVPGLTAFPGSLPDGFYYVTMAWVNASGDSGAPATVTGIATTSSTILVAPTVAPATAVGWNVFVGTSPDMMFCQNTTPLGLGQTWEQPATLLQSGLLPGKGQEPSYLQRLPRVLQRG